MELREQLVSLELAKKMKELGFKQKSLWWWVEYGDNLEFTNVTSYTQGVDYEPPIKMYSAYTVAELGEMLPDVYQIIHTKFSKSMFKNQHCYVGCKIDFTETEFKVEVIEGEEILDDTEANARARMLIYLKEKGLI